MGYGIFLMSHHIIEAVDLHYTYPDGTIGLCDISFRITHGESVALIGANGAGKSTLLLHLNGCLFPTKGNVLIGHIPVNQKNVKSVRRTVGMVFQDPDNQLFMPTVFDDVAFGPINLGMPEANVEQTVLHSLETVGAAHLIKRPPYKLSGGEKRAVAIAAVLATTPSVLVMDEPSSNLDPRSRKRVINLIRTFEHTKIIATHDMDMALDLCERTIVLHEGKITADGPTVEIFNNDSFLEKNGLEKPMRMQGCPICSKRQ